MAQQRWKGHIRNWWPREQEYLLGAKVKLEGFLKIVSGKR